MKNLYALNFRLLILSVLLGWHLPIAKAQTPYTISGTTFLDYGGSLELDDKAMRHPALEVIVYASADTEIDAGDTELGSTISALNGAFEITVTPDAALTFNHFLLQIAESSVLSTSQRITKVLPVQSTADANVAFIGQPVACFAASDRLNKLMFINRLTGRYEIFDGAFDAPEIETVAFVPGGDILYAMDKGTFGSIDLTTGLFTPINAIGTLAGSEGDIGNIDADGMAFDPYTKVLFAVGRRNDQNDYLFQINPTNGQAVLGAFGTGVDYVVIQNPDNNAVLNDVDDIAINPADGKIYGVNSNGADANDPLAEEYLIEIDKKTGVATIINPLNHNGSNIQDVEGFGFTNFGLLLATTGDQTPGTGPFNGNPTRLLRNSMYSVNLETATLDRVGSFEDKGLQSGLTKGEDVEGCDCLIAPINSISGKVYADANRNAENNQEEGLGGGIKINVYIDANNDGIRDDNDILVDCISTEPDGTYTWSTAANINLILEVDPSTVPDGFFPTDDEKETADLACCFGGQDEENKDFGFFTQIFPVEWLGFDAAYEKQNALLDWATATEINSHYFEVQRSLDARTFSPIGRVESKGNSNSMVEYQYTDKGITLLATQKIYYRLRQVDLDGTWGYSKIIELNIPDQALGLKVYPNPASSTLSIHNTNPDGQQMNILLIDIRGKYVRSGVVEAAQKLEWSVSDLARGVYYLRATQDGRTFSQKVIVE